MTNPAMDRVVYGDYADEIIPLNERIDENRYNNSLYTILPENYFNVSFSTDNHLLVSLFCDFFGFDDNDFEQLIFMRDNEGMYADTHVFLYMILLTDLGCYDSEKIDRERDKLANEMVIAQDKETNFTDIGAERITVFILGGYGNLVKKEWITLLEEARPEYLELLYDNPEHTDIHAIAFAELALIYYEEGKNKQDYYSR